MKKIKNILYVAATLFLGVSCNRYLEKTPRAQLSPEIALSDSVGVQGTLASSYRRLNQFEYYGRDIMLLGDVLADNARIAVNSGRYTTQIDNQIFSHFNFWNGAPYAAINDANYVIEAADKTEIRMSDNLRKRLKGEALFIRALCHHDLMRAYSYEPANASGFSFSVVLRNKPTKGLSDAEGAVRASVAEGYDFIIKDLQQAISLFETIPNVGFPNRANLASAQALLARVYLYAGRFADAADAADAALNTVDNQPTPRATLSTAASHAGSFNTTIHPEALFEVDINAADWSTVDGVNNSLSSWTRSLTSTFTPPLPAPGPGPIFAIAGSNSLNALIIASDARRGVWSPTAECGKWRGEKGVYLENVPVIRYAELVLIQAEGRARSGNDAVAQTALNRLRTNRGLPTVTPTGTALTDEIMLQRRIEFAFEGHRWFDLKRLGLPISKDPAQGAALSASDPRVLAPIPATELGINPKLVQNPGY
ncbi:MAG: RagB/SusD family nutrient uptake outer membrane protein [Raineya sp.]|jgi:tetratricopeptide (TPR) repeat protein|nr:RagB/SusD family nutrient uptake outer membrane protein [Raineya sp.]